MTPGSECECDGRRWPARVYVLVPMKRLELCKTRLSGVLVGSERLALVRALARRVARAAEGSAVAACKVFVTSGCPDPFGAAGATRGAWHALDVGDLGLNAGLEAAVDWSAARGAEYVLILPIDLPFADPGSVRAVVAESLRTGRHVIVPDHHGAGTNVLCMNLGHQFRLGFGPGSMRRHFEAARSSGGDVLVMCATPLRQDLDTAEDLVAVRRAGAMPTPGAEAADAWRHEGTEA